MLRKKLLAPVEVMQTKIAQEKRIEFKETMNMIRDTANKDVLENARMAELKR